jgi:hypothetical protein
VLVELDGCLCAGSSDVEDDDSSVLKFDPVVGAWSALPPWIIPRTGYSLVVAAVSLFVCAGAYDAMDDEAPCASECFNLEPS